MALPRLLPLLAPLLMHAGCAVLGPPPADIVGTVRVDGHSLHYEAFGDAAETIVLVHGGGVDRRLWDGQVVELARTFEVVRYDRRGYGYSSTPQADYSDAADLRALLDELEIERAHLVGSSTGAGVVLDFALRHPDRVRSLVLVSAKVDGYRYSGHETSRVNAIFHAARTAGDEAAVERWLAAPGLFAGTDGRAPARLRELLLDNRQVFHFPSELRATARHTVPLLSEIEAPTLVVSGGADSPDHRRLSEMLAERIRGARVALIPDAGHMLPMETPRRFNELVLKFLHEVLASEAP